MFVLSGARKPELASSETSEALYAARLWLHEDHSRSGGVTSLLLAHCASQNKFMKTIASLVVCSLFFVSTLPASPLEEQNKAIAKQAFEEVLSKGNFAVAGQFYAKDFLSHGVNRDANLTEDQALLKGWRESFSDVRVWPRKLMAEGDLVTVYWVVRGENLVATNGFPGTGKIVRSSGITIWRIVDGKIKEQWSAFDRLDMMQQLGLIPPDTK